MLRREITVQFLLFRMKIFAITLSMFIIAGCETMPPIKPGPYCGSTAASDCREFGIAYGTDEMQACVKKIQQKCAESRQSSTATTAKVTPGSDIHFMADMTSICRKIGHQYGTPSMEQCIRDNRQKFLQGGDWRTLLTTSEKKSISELSTKDLKGLRADILCAATRAEPGYKPTENVLNEVKSRRLICESLTILTQKERGDINSRAKVQSNAESEFDKCISDVNLSALQCTLGCWGRGGSCHQICDDRKIAQTDRCEARLKGVPYQYNAPVQNEPSVVVPQQQNNINPNVCIQDGGGAYCPNHPNTQRRDPLRNPVFR